MSCSFYRALGFEESAISAQMSYFSLGTFGFYLQNAFVKDWVNNTQVFLEVSDVQRHFERVRALDLPAKFEGVRIVPMRQNDWGREFFVHDPSGILWHFGEFK